MKKLLPLFLLACGGEATTLDIASLEEPIRADDNFGVHASDMQFCPANPGTCYYPPGFGDGTPSYTDMVTKEWRVCINFAGFDITQGINVANALDTVNAHLVANGAWSSYVGGCDQANIKIVSTSALPAYGTLDVRRYAQATCDNFTSLFESPTIPGNHRYCHSWTIAINPNRIDTDFGTSTRDEAMLHAVGVGMGIAELGAGVHTGGANNLFSYFGMLPLPKTGFSAIEYCRAHARYDFSGQYNTLTRIDNGCD